MNIEKDHIFINYAVEDSPVAHWLAYQLIALGYKVWCDKLKLLGGESYPRDIDEAIKNQTFRFVSLLSRVSLEKPNPLKERTLALNITRKFGPADFIIPLNLENIEPAELNWQLSDINFIDFSSWAEGLKSLVKKLESINTPKTPTLNSGLLTNTFLTDDICTQSEETIYSNSYKIKKIPATLKRFSVKKMIKGAFWQKAIREWPFYRLGDYAYAAFENPPDLLFKELGVELLGEIKWKSVEDVSGTKVGSIISSLLKRSLFVHGIKRKLAVPEENPQQLYFPPGILQKDKIKYVSFNGKASSLQVVGLRKHWTPNNPDEKTRYYISPQFTIKQNQFNEQFLIQLRTGVYLTAQNNEPLPAKSQNSRRKKICMNWWNDKWLNWQFAIMTFLSEGKNELVLGQDAKFSIVIEASPITFKAPYGINEDKLKPSELVDLEMLVVPSDESEELK